MGGGGSTFYYYEVLIHCFGGLVLVLAACGVLRSKGGLQTVEVKLGLLFIV